MATENQQTNPERNSSEAPSDRQFSAEEAQEVTAKADKSALETSGELSEREVFAGDEDFYELLANTARSNSTRQSASPNRPCAVPIQHKRFSPLQKVLAAGIVGIASMLLYALLKSPSGPAADIMRGPNAQQAIPPEPPVEELAQASRETAPQQTQEPKHVVPPTQPLSLKAAETLYLQKDYDNAYAVYDRLYQGLPATAEEELLRDSLQLKMALCMKEAVDFDQANRLLRAASKSRSPAIRVLANYHLSMLEIQKKQYFNARTKAYQVIALIGAVDFDNDSILSLLRDCHFLVAESITRNVLSLCDADKNLPAVLWSRADLRNVTNEDASNSFGRIDPLTNLNEAELRSLLKSGLARLSKGLLGPQIQKLDSAGKPSGSFAPRWSIVCQGAAIEELLARFAANAGLDIRWVRSNAPASEDTENAIRKRPVSLYMPAVTAQQFVTVATGCVGLLARLDDEGTVYIFNPADYSALSEHIDLLSQEAASLWQRFLLSFHGDERVPNAHFALGLVRAQRGQMTDAIAEYKLVANRFSQTSLAPFALLCSSRLKTNLHDYFGAREDLKQLIELYPDSECSGQACLQLANATMKAGLYDEAGRLYRKVYNLGFSLQSRAAAALGASKCFYEGKDYESAAKWLTLYISIAGDRTTEDLYSAYLLLGRTYLALGKSEQACDALQNALTVRQPAKEEYVEIVSTLVKAHVQQEHFLEALGTLEDVRSWQLSQKELAEILLLKANVLCAMGSVDKAIATLGDRAEYLADLQLKSKISLELANCYITQGNLELAHRKLTEILRFVEAGALGQEIALKLAEVCLKLDRSSQSISICLQLLDSGPSEQTRQKTLVLLAKAHKRQKNFDRAALALLGQWWEVKHPKEKVVFDQPTTTGRSIKESQ